MPISESMVQDIVQEVMAKMQIADAPAGKHGIFTDMNEAIEAAKASQKIVRKMSLDQREKIITCIRRKTKENAEILARMGVDETGMGNVGDKILKHHLVADKTPGTEDITTTSNTKYNHGSPINKLIYRAMARVLKVKILVYFIKGLLAARNSSRNSCGILSPYFSFTNA